MDSSQERPYATHGLTHSEVLLRQLDRVADARPTSVGAAAGLGELLHWMAEEQPSSDRGRSPGAFEVLVVGGPQAGKTTFVHAASDGPDGPDAAAALRPPGGRGRVTLAEEHVLDLLELPHEAVLRAPGRGGLVGDARGAVLLVDVNRLEDGFAWLDHLEAYDVPYVVAVNRFAHAYEHPVSLVRDVLDLREGSPVVSCDAREGLSAREVLRALYDAALGGPAPASAMTEPSSGE